MDRFNASELSPIRREQFLAAGNKAWGKSDLDGVLDASEESDMFWEHARVTDGAEVALYDAWLLGACNGTLFLADTTTESGLVMIESSFVAETKMVAGLGASMKAAYVAARPAFDVWMEAYEAYWVEFREKESDAARRRGGAGS